MTKSRKVNDIIVRELGTGYLNTVAIAPNATEVKDNLASFFNDTPYDLDLVAIRCASILMGKPIPNADVASYVDAFGVAEVSRQSIAGQQEGILMNVRSRMSYLTGLNANGGKASYDIETGEHFIGDMKTPLMTLEVQSSIFLNGVITNSINSFNTLAIGDVNHQLGCTLYFRVRSTGYRAIR